MSTVFDIIVPTFDNRDELEACLEGFVRQTFTSFRVLVCVDGSTDGTQEWLATRTYPFPLAVLCHPDGRNHGRNATRNLALPLLEAPLLCFVDSDLVPAADLLERHHAVLQGRDCVSVGDVAYTDAATNVWAAYSQSRGKNKYPGGSEIPHYYLATGNCAQRTEHFLAVGGQDAGMSRYGGGDTEYALRLHAKTGLPVVFTSHARCTGNMNRTLDAAMSLFEECGRTNLRVIHERHPSETRVFYLHRLTGRGWSDRMFRAVLRPRVERILRTMAPHLPLPLAVPCINYCIITRLWMGWRAASL
ncbi:MAG: glycosyltransferase family 2 protein [Candidatus Kapaibacterium sp.]